MKKPIQQEMMNSISPPNAPQLDLDQTSAQNPIRMIGKTRIHNVTAFKLTEFDLLGYESFTDIFQLEHENCFYLIGLINAPGQQESATLEFSGDYWLDQCTTKKQEAAAERRFDIAMDKKIDELGINY